MFTHRRQKALSAVVLPAELKDRLAGYVSSVAVDASGEVAAVTSSRGNLTAMIEIRTGRSCAPSRAPTYPACLRPGCPEHFSPPAAKVPSCRSRRTMRPAKP